MSTKCVFAGTFDPFTIGHCDTVEKCLKLFDEVVIVIARNTKKQFLFSEEERKEMIEAVYRGEPRVRVTLFSGVMADFLKREQTPFYVRGVRNTVDFEYENADYFASKRINGDMIAIYLPSEQEHLHVSSTLVKNCIAFEKPYREYVPEAVYAFMQKRGSNVPSTK